MWKFSRYEEQCGHGTHTYIWGYNFCNVGGKLWLDEHALERGEYVPFEGADEQCVDCGVPLAGDDDYGCAKIVNGGTAVKCSNCGSSYHIKKEYCHGRFELYQK